ncbi:hypothetical protein [Phosphitispora fastidiosa]|uniref:hypothetical protein n=1 Tax=Phosphitispora fastidiosa TaxID=2837202 RepID=UPI001E39209B|nr:hypothetical protein [Phosphitispora fastidiosa]MBU7006020.1 nitric oxide reductase large subunit [Phosphitispora fastidiosa]
MDKKGTISVKIIKTILTFIFICLSVLVILGSTTILIGLKERFVGDIGYNGQKLEEFIEFTFVNIILLIITSIILKKIRKQN